MRSICRKLNLWMRFEGIQGEGTMKIDRLIGIIMILLRQGRATAPELAERFEVSRRTINRDIEDICRAGIPLVTMQGYGGGISIADSFKVDRSLITQEELQAIFFGVKGLDGVSERPHFRALAEKLCSGPADTAAEGAILIDLASHYQTPLTQKIAAVKGAIQERRRLSFRYCYEKGECRRTIEPYKLVFKWSSWYVWGYCLDREAFRLFKLNRLWDIEWDGERFETRKAPVEELDLDRFFSAGTLHLKARFAQSEKYRLIEEYGVGCYQEERERGLLLERDFVSWKNMREWVLSFGDRVEVLEPEELRADLRRQAENLLRQYQDT